MKLLNEMLVYYRNEPRTIRLYHGDLTERSEATNTDLLVVSAWQSDYSTTFRTLITSLQEKGISVQELSRDKEEDLRAAFNTWLSKPLPLSETLPPYKRILCFEPPNDAQPNAFVADIFQGLMPFLGHPDYDIDSLSMPLVATGKRGAKPLEILEAILEAAVQWMAHGMPLKDLHIVEHNETKASEVSGAFEILKRQYARFGKPRRRYAYDMFVSYSHENTDAVMRVMDRVQALRPELEVFLDRQDLNAGSVWQQELYDALDDCGKVLAFYSPDYLNSKVCKEEFNIAIFRHRDSEEGILIPVYIMEASLPTYMKLIQFIDARAEIAQSPEAVADLILAHF
ncbi:MAG: toll/interleukin-1 receptor domain-containing protein [Lewinellaceae bacterium]|nr:toll/interleukin-1 receptor domain-containing protein [Lewinellaceae bacterium]